MILMTLEIVVTPVQRSKTLRALRQLAGPLEVQPGCLSCRILEDLRAESVIGLAAAWDSEENLEQHVRSRHFWNLLALMEVSRRKPDIKFHLVDRITGLESVEQIRGARRDSRPAESPDRSGPTLQNR